MSPSCRTLLHLAFPLFYVFTNLVCIWALLETSPSSFCVSAVSPRFFLAFLVWQIVTLVRMAGHFCHVVALLEWDDDMVLVPTRTPEIPARRRRPKEGLTKEQLARVAIVLVPTPSQVSRSIRPSVSSPSTLTLDLEAARLAARGKDAVKADPKKTARKKTQASEPAAAQGGSKAKKEEKTAINSFCDDCGACSSRSRNALHIYMSAPRQHASHHITGICFSPFARKQRARVLHCGHRFHCACVDPWLRRRPTCPICRKHATNNPEPPPEGSV